MQSFGKESLVWSVMNQGMNVLLNYGDEHGLDWGRGLFVGTGAWMLEARFVAQLDRDKGG